MKCPICGSKNYDCSFLAPLERALDERRAMITTSTIGGPAMGMFVSDRRIYINSKGKACEANDPDRQRLLVGKGGSISGAEAQRYGLVPPPVDRFAEPPSKTPEPVPQTTLEPRTLEPGEMLAGGSESEGLQGEAITLPERVIDEPKPKAEPKRSGKK